MSIISQGLSAQQERFRVIQSNISNAGVDGYSEKRVPLATDSFGRQGIGVKTLPEQRLEDTIRTEEVRQKVVGVSYLETIQDLHSKINRQMGKPGNAGALGTHLTHVKTALSTLENNPSNATAQREAVDKLQAFTGTVNKLSTFVQDERKIAEHNIVDSIQRINSILETIHDLNAEIALQSGRGDTVGNLKDRQDLILKDLSQYMDITVFRRDNDALDITTNTGQALLIQSGPKTLTFQEAAAIGPQTTTGMLSKIEVDGIPISDSISSGKIAALFKARDDLFPKIQESLDQFTVHITNHMNALHNRGTASVPANELTGTVTFADPTTDTIQMTGIVRLAVIDQATGAHAVAPMDLDFTAGLTTINDVATAIDTALGLNGSATVTADNRLQITAANGAHGIGLVSLSDPEAVDTVSNKGFSHHFGLNDLLTNGTDPVGAANVLDVHTRLKDNPKLLASATLSTEAFITQPQAVYIGDASNLSAILESFDDRLDFAAAGSLSAQTVAATDYANALYHTLAVEGKNNQMQLDIDSTILTDSEQELAAHTGVNMQRQYQDMLDAQQILSALTRLLKVEDEILRQLTSI